MTGNWHADCVRVENLSIRFGPGNAMIDQVSLALAKGKITALVGESGSGKSLIAHAMMGILTPAARLEADLFAFGGVDLRDPRGSGWRDLRGRQIAIIFQNPRAALSPVRRVGAQIGDVLAAQQFLRGAALRQAIIDALAAVQITEPEARAMAYPGELSGGMCQRVMIALALACNPALLIADEPTTGLDTTTQAAILELIVTAARERHMACLLITHDLALARRYAERVIVMHAGQIAESADANRFFSGPRHPYARALMSADASAARSIAELGAVPGAFPDLRGKLPACRYAGRCSRAETKCHTEKPPYLGDDRSQVACWRPLE